MSAIAVDGLHHRYGDFVALHDLAFEIPAGEVVALLGPNGSGKTTTLEVLEGYLPPTAGRVAVLGADPRRAGRTWRARIGVVLQSTSLDSELTVCGALTVFSQLYAHARPIGEVLELIGLAADTDTRIGQLSGGQQRRVDLGLGLIGRPELLFLDEPTTGLDPAARRTSWTIIEQLASEGTTVLLSTHYMDEAQHLADRLLVLDHGRLVADCTPAELRASTATSRVRLPIPPDASIEDPPARFAGHLASGELDLLVDGADLPAVLGELLEWAGANGVDVAGLQVVPPSLEDVYLRLTTPEQPAHVPSHA
jgi:ABC-2 type transport system ATP-binding protein